MLLLLESVSEFSSTFSTARRGGRRCSWRNGYRHCNRRRRSGEGGAGLFPLSRTVVVAIAVVTVDRCVLKTMAF